MNANYITAIINIPILYKVSIGNWYLPINYILCVIMCCRRGDCVKIIITNRQRLYYCVTTLYERDVKLSFVTSAGTYI